MGWRQGPTLGKTLKGEHTHVAFTLEDSTIELAFKEMKSAIKLQDQWYAAAELKDERAWISDRLRDYKFPAKEAAFLARHSNDLKPVDSKAGEVEGSLTKKAIYDILSRGRNVVEEAPGVSGRVSFRVEKGQLVGYEYTLKGKMTMPPDAREVILDRTTVVEIQDVRNTKVSLPQECQIKLK